VHSLEHIVHDFKHSNYFRIWCLVFLACFIIFWIGFGVYVNHVDTTSQVYASGFQPNDAVEFPLYHFRLEGMTAATPAIVTNSISCIWNNTVPLSVDTCLGYNNTWATGLTNCFVVQTHNKTFSAWASMDNSGRENPFEMNTNPDLFSSPAHGPGRIYCNFSVNPNALGQTPNWIAWELEGLTNYQYGDNAYAALWFDNMNIQWVLLEQFQIDGTIYWDRNRESHLPALPQNDTLGNTLYQTVTIMDTTTVQFYEQFSFGYHSWNGLADIGGLAFALYIMKTVLMLVVGLMFENDSIFLGGKEPAKDTERTPIVQS